VIEQFNKIEIAAEFLKAERLRRAQIETRAQNHVYIVSCTDVIPQQVPGRTQPVQTRSFQLGML
jgi:hypothetical protein